MAHLRSLEIGVHRATNVTTAQRSVRGHHLTRLCLRALDSQSDTHHIMTKRVRHDLLGSVYGLDNALAAGERLSSCQGAVPQPTH